MASALVDLVKINVLSDGTGALTLGSAVQGYRGTEALTDGVEYGYSIQQDGTFECGRGAYFGSGRMLARLPLQSSNGGVAINLLPNAQVAFVALAEDLDLVTAAGDAEASASAAAASASQALDAETNIVSLLAQNPMVTTYGAVGDDTTDNTAAFAAAAASGLNMTIPEGIYRVGGVTFTGRVTFMPGAQIRRTGGSLAFSGGITAPIAQQIFLDAVYPNVDINNTLTPEGWVDWFGLGENAMVTCHKIFRVNRFGPRDYFADVTGTIVFDQSYREIIGCEGSAEGAGGTRIVQTVGFANQPIVRVGTLNTTAVSSCARRLNIWGINTIRGGASAPAASNRREDAVPGWLLCGWYESRIEKCFDYGSPIHFRVYGTISCMIRDCSGVRPGAGTSNGHTDFYTAFAIGGYATSFGFIGANASLTVDNCGTAGATGASRMGMYLFGYIGDTWVRKFEMSQLEYGVFIDGADASGTTITGLSAHQDVRLSECVLDSLNTNCITVQNINTGGGISIFENYCALNAAGDGILVKACFGMVSIDGGDNIANSTLANIGIHVLGSKRVSVSPSTKFKDFRVGMRAESSGQCHLAPTISRANTGGTNAVETATLARSYVAPIIDADVAAFDYCIAVDVPTNFCEFNLSSVNYGCLTTVTSARKIWANGATWGGGATFGSSNIATGVLN